MHIQRVPATVVKSEPARSMRTGPLSSLGEDVDGPE